MTLTIPPAIGYIFLVVALVAALSLLLIFTTTVAYYAMMVSLKKLKIVWMFTMALTFRTYKTTWNMRQMRRMHDILAEEDPETCRLFASIWEVSTDDEWKDAMNQVDRDMKGRWEFASTVTTEIFHRLETTRNEKAGI
jgi:hypothetical protein